MRAIDPSERIPAAHALHLASVAEGLGVDRQALLRDWGLDAETLADPEQTLDLATYDYYRTLFSILEGGLGTPNPANPETNLSNGALGYFGACTISRDTIVIQAL